LPLLTYLWYFNLKTLGDHAELHTPINQNQQTSFPHALSLKRSRRPPIFISFLGQVNHYLSPVKILKKSIKQKIYVWESLGESLRIWDKCFHINSCSHCCIWSEKRQQSVSTADSICPLLIFKPHFKRHTGLILGYSGTHVKKTSAPISSRTMSLFFESWHLLNDYNNNILNDVLKGSDPTIHTCM